MRDGEVESSEALCEYGVIAEGTAEETWFRRYLITQWVWSPVDRRYRRHTGYWWQVM